MIGKMRFELISKEIQSQLIGLKEHYHSDYTWGSLNLEFGLYNVEQKIFMTECGYLSEGIKHCGEPDDHYFVFITPEQSFQVLCWKTKDNKIQLKKVFHTHRMNEEVRSVDKDVIEAMAGFYLENEWSFRKERK